MKKNTPYLCIITGGAIAIYANAKEQQNVYFLILGIVLLMFGVFKLNKAIPSKFEKPESTNYFIEEQE